MKEAMNSAITLSNLHYSVNGAKILEGIHLQIQKGEFVGLIGPNGAGKTTLLKCINGIYKAQGELRINGQMLYVLQDKEIARKISLMQQNTSLNSPFSSMDVVLMGRYPHLKRMQAESKEDYTIARTNMSYTDTLQFGQRAITQLSGGERQRVLFAKVLTQETDIMLLDEPTASLDISHQEEIFRYSEKCTKQGKIVIAAVHDLKIASRYCSRIVLMKNGVILADGKTDEVLTSRNLSEAYEMNVLVYRNKVTGLLDFHNLSHLEKEDENKKKKACVHVIGGGGSASGVMRQLFESGYTVTAGVFALGDSDHQCAEVFGMTHAVCEPFSDIGDEVFEANIEMIQAADITILCNLLFGRQNLKNLIAAKQAKKLIIIEDETPEARDFTGGEAALLYHELRQTAIVTTSARLHEVF